MTKTFRMIGICIVAVLMCAGFAACSDNDDDNEVSSGKAKGGRLLTSITEHYYDEEEGGWFECTPTTFQYDSKGRISQIIDGDGVLTYTWGETAVECQWIDSRETEEYTFHLVNGLCTRVSGDRRWYGAYNDKGWIISDEGDPVIWSANGDLTEAYGYDYTYYTDKPCKRYIMFTDSHFGPLDFDDYMVLAHPELFGLHCNYLPKTKENDYRKYTFTYELDGKGYPKRINIKEVVPETEYSYGDTDEYYITLTWK